MWLAFLFSKVTFILIDLSSPLQLVATVSARLPCSNAGLSPDLLALGSLLTFLLFPFAKNSLWRFVIHKMTRVWVPWGKLPGVYIADGISTTANRMWQRRPSVTLPPAPCALVSLAISDPGIMSSPCQLLLGHNSPVPQSSVTAAFLPGLRVDYS